MPLTPAEMDEKIDAHFRYEAADDVDGVLATLAGDVEHDIVGAPTGPTQGRDGARAFYEGLFADFADSSVTTLRRYYGDDFLVDESLWRGKAPGRPFGLDGKGRDVSFRMLHILEFADDGAIRRENVWLDFAAVMRQLG